MRLPPPGEGRRLLLGLVLPSLVLSIANIFIFPFVFLVSIFAFGIPSLFFSIVMEFAINQRIKSDILAIILGSALVTVVASPWAPYAGGVVGFLSSAILRVDYIRSMRRIG
jgi:hypothetical protein